jgi:hypothetical protein
MAPYLNRRSGPPHYIGFARRTHFDNRMLRLRSQLGDVRTNKVPRHSRAGGNPGSVATLTGTLSQRQSLSAFCTPSVFRMGFEWGMWDGMCAIALAFTVLFAKRDRFQNLHRLEIGDRTTTRKADRYASTLEERFPNLLD